MKTPFFSLLSCSFLIKQLVSAREVPLIIDISTIIMADGQRHSRPGMLLFLTFIFRPLFPWLHGGTFITPTCPDVSPLKIQITSHSGEIKFIRQHGFVYNIFSLQISFFYCLGSLNHIFGPFS